MGMASDQEFVEYAVGQIDADCVVTYKKMFGEYGLYSDGKFFGSVCDNRLFIKPTEGGGERLSVMSSKPHPIPEPSRAS